MLLQVSRYNSIVEGQTYNCYPPRTNQVYINAVVAQKILKKFSICIICQALLQYCTDIGAVGREIQICIIINQELKHVDQIVSHSSQYRNACTIWDR